MIRNSLCVLAFGFSPSLILAQEASTWEKVLLPIVASTQIAGANDARFSTAFSAIAAKGPVRYFPSYAFETGGTVGPPEVGTLMPGLVSPIFFPASFSRNGRLLFLEQPLASGVTLAAHLFSSSGPGDVFHETALPVVRSADFITGTAQILGIRSSYRYGERPNTTCRDAFPQFRHTLRVYDVDAHGDAIVQVRIYLEDGQNSTLRREAMLTLSESEGDDQSFPAWGEMAIEEICRPFSCRTPCAGGSERVEITPVSPGLRFWAMVSATDNLTQQVSLAFPQ